MRDRRLLTGLALALSGGLLLALAALAVAQRDSPEPPSPPAADLMAALAAARPAAAPFEGLTAADLARGDRCARFVIADTAEERSRGLRQVRDLGPYAGMLFVFETVGQGAFTMADTPLPLDITWFDAGGREVGRATMEPCPEGTDLTCPLYRSDRPYRYALEVPAGSGGGGSLSPCA